MSIQVHPLCLPNHEACSPAHRPHHACVCGAQVSAVGAVVGGLSGLSARRQGDRQDQGHQVGSTHPWTLATALHCPTWRVHGSEPIHTSHRNRTLSCFGSSSCPHFTSPTADLSRPLIDALSVAGRTPATPCWPTATRRWWRRPTSASSSCSQRSSTSPPRRSRHPSRRSTRRRTRPPRPPRAHSSSSYDGRMSLI